MSARSRILIAEDHTLVREGLRLLLQMNPDLEVVAEVDNGRDAVRVAGETTPDLVLMDLSMPGMNGIEAIAEIKARYPKIKIVVLTVHTNEEYIHACIRGGANGYIVKDATRDQFMSAVRDVMLGHTHLCSVATEKIIGWFMTGAKTTGPASPWDALTHRERQILKLIAEGHTNKGMAKFLSISPKTVEKHRANLMAKLDVHSTAGLTAYAVNRGLVDGSVVLSEPALLTAPGHFEASGPQPEESMTLPAPCIAGHDRTDHRADSAGGVNGEVATDDVEPFSHVRDARASLTGIPGHCGG
jgi:DNA-binding NarL/FixJ family response regulator